MHPRPSFSDALELWITIAAQSFGGPAGQIAVMHRVLVEEKRWLSDERFLHALNYCMLLPGPEAQQLVTWCGWLSHGYRGAFTAGWLFVLPGFATILMLSNVYARYHEVPAVAAALVGLKAAVLVVVVEALIRIGRRVSNQPATVLVSLASFVALFVFEVPFPLVIACAGAIGYAGARWFPPPAPPKPKDGGQSPPVLDALLDAGQLPHVAPNPRRDVAVGLAIAAAWLLPTAVSWAVLGPDATYTKIGTFFSGAAVVTFGGAYSVLAYVAQHAVEQQQWLTAGEMLDGLGLAETTPGPLIQVVQFVGFLAAWRDPGALPPAWAGFAASVLTTWVTFTPSFAFILAGAPYVERVRAMTTWSSALRAITAAVVGVIANLGVWLTLHVWFAEVTETTWHGARLVVPSLGSAQPVPIALSAAAAVAMLRFHVPMAPVLVVSALAGLAAWAAFGG